MQLVGLMLMLAGLVLHWWARVHLGQFFGERIEYQPGQYLVESGPYAYVCHPIYTAFYLCVVGLLLVNPALTTLLVTIYFFWDFCRTAREEEALLSERLTGYEEYLARTPRYLPALGQLLGTRGSSTHGRRNLPEPENH
jgi:protein-S-isoprenylcysteine O-methyltransferase Ste14